jgi:low affinity Fe/Cu permease
MKKIYRHSETVFEKITTVATALLGNSITFMLALGIIVFWLVNKEFYMQDARDSIRDVIHGVTFLSLFIIQKSFNRFSALLHLKVNELVSSHEPANNAVLNAEDKTEHELIELSKEYADLDLHSTVGEEENTQIHYMKT